MKRLLRVLRFPSRPTGAATVTPPPEGRHRLMDNDVLPAAGFPLRHGWNSPTLALRTLQAPLMTPGQRYRAGDWDERDGWATTVSPGLKNLLDEARDITTRHRPSGTVLQLCVVCFTAWECRAYRNARTVQRQFGDDGDESA